MNGPDPQSPGLVAGDVAPRRAGRHHMPERLTERQRQVLQFIKDQIRRKGYPPSVREIGEAIGLSSSSTVHGHLARLEEKGYLRRDPTKPRAIEVLDDEPKAVKRVVNVPVVGRVTAGQPILAAENIEDYFPVPSDFLRPDEEYNVFFLSVQGDSMIGAGILDGDYVLVRRTSAAQNGDIVVALVPGPGEPEATVKRFFREVDHIRLQPENPNLEPIRVRECTILGKVVGLVRRFD